MSKAAGEFRTMPRKKSQSPADCSETVDFDSLLVEIEDIVEQLEQGDLSLSQSLQNYETAVGKLKLCHEVLNDAEQRISLLSGFDADGNPVLEVMESSQDETLANKQANRGRRRSAAGTKAKRRKPASSSSKPPGDKQIDSPGIDDNDENDGFPDVDDADVLF